MKKIIFLVVLFCFLNVSNFSQIQIKQKKTVSNPLDCALYLIQTENELETRNQEVVYLSDFYWKSGLREKAIEVTDLVSDDTDKVKQLVRFARELKNEGKASESEKLYLKAFSILKENDEFDSVYKDKILVEIINELVTLKQSKEVLELINETNSNHNNAFILLAVADGFLKNRQKDKALELIPQILQFAQNSKWKDLELFAKAKVGTIYLKSGNQKEAELLYKEVLTPSSSLKEIENIFVDDLWREVFDGYKSVNNLGKAIETLLAYQQINTLNSNGRYTKANLIETYLDNNQKEEALKLLNQLTVDNDDYSLLAIEIYLKLGDENSAKNIFLFTNNNYDKQQIALKLFDYYVAKGKIEFAKNILNLALDEVKKIKTEKPESGMMSTSPQMQKANYLSQISQKLIDLKEYETALKIINSIEKPYYKAKMLAELAEKQNSKNSTQLLNQSLLIMQRNKDSLLDAGKYQVWNKIAYTFAKIGNKNKAGEIFAELLSNDEEIYSEGLDGYLLQTLAETGFYFKVSGLNSDKRVTKTLQKIIKNWEEENH